MRSAPDSALQPVLASTGAGAGAGAGTGTRAGAGAVAVVGAGDGAAGVEESFGEATDMQLEELEALEAIFGSEYRLVSSCPPIFVISLREPGSEEADEVQACSGTAQPPSALFSLKVKLPKVRSWRLGSAVLLCCSVKLCRLMVNTHMLHRYQRALAGMEQQR